MLFLKDKKVLFVVSERHNARYVIVGLKDVCVDWLNLGSSEYSLFCVVSKETKSSSGIWRGDCVQVSPDGVRTL